MTVSLYLLKFEVTTLNSASTVFCVSAGATEWRWHRNWHLTWRLSDRWGTIRSTSACHPSRSLRKSAAGKDPVNCLQMCLDACFTDKHVEGAALWWYHRSLLICISLPESCNTPSELVFAILDTNSTDSWQDILTNLLIAYIFSWATACQSMEVLL